MVDDTLIILDSNLSGPHAGWFLCNPFDLLGQLIVQLNRTLLYAKWCFITYEQALKYFLFQILARKKLGYCILNNHVISFSNVTLKITKPKMD